jgi:hypothetical protein
MGSPEVKGNGASCPRYGLQITLKKWEQTMSRAKLTNLFDARYKVYFCERQLGISHLSDTTKSVYELIAKQEMTIQRIVDHKYFSGVCLSTIKRSVVDLLNNELIIARIGSKDKRERILTLRIT